MKRTIRNMEGVGVDVKAQEGAALQGAGVHQRRQGATADAKNLNRKYKMNNGTRKNNSAMVGGAKKTIGTKAQVYHGTAKHTSGGLKKKDLMKTKKGRIVSRKKHAAGQKAIKKLRKLGYVAKKGKFMLFTKKSKRGGSASMMPDMGSGL